MDMMLKGKTAVITGGASGLGLETARYMAHEGMNLVLADINDETLGIASREIREIGADVATLKIDVRRYEDCQEMADLAVEKFGGVDVLVASAGVGGETWFLESKPEDWERILDINIKGVLNSNRAIGPLMVERGGGSIINIASEAGKTGEKRSCIYGASKAAVMGFTRSFSIEMGMNSIRVNAICPAVTITPMTARIAMSPELVVKASKKYVLGRLGQPRDIASMITFLASDQASWITGQSISVNGGFARW